MASQRKIRAGRAFVEVNADDNGLQKVLRRAEVRLKSFGAGVAKIGAGILAAGAGLAAPFTAATAIFAKVGDQLDKASLRTGLSVEALSELGFAAERSGASMEEVEKGVRKLSVSIRGGVQGLKTYTDAFDDLGLDARKLEKLAVEDQFIAVAEALSKIEHPGKRAALAVQLLGKGGAQLLPLMAGGAEGIEALRIEARKLGLTIDTETATSAAMLTDAMGDLKSQVKAVAIAVGSALGPSLTRTIRLINPIVTRTIDFVKLNKPLVSGVAAVAASAIVAGTALVFLGGAISVAGVAVGGLASIIGLTLSPIALVIAAVGALSIAVARYTNVLGTAGVALRAVFGPLASRVIAVLGAIRDALLAGDLPLALQVVTLSMRATWLKAMVFLEDRWDAARVVILKSMASFWTSLNKIWNFGAAAAMIAIEGLLGSLRKLGIFLATPVGPDYFDRLAEQFAAVEAEVSISAGKIISKAFSDNAEIDSASKGIQKIIDSFRDSTGESDLVNELKSAREALQQAIERARIAKIEADQERESFQFDLDDLGKSLKEKLETFGSFGGSGLSQSIGGGRNEELEQAKATAKNTRRTAEAIARLESRLAFG